MSLVKRITEYTIFEDPNGFETVYIKLPGEEMRELSVETSDDVDKIAEIKQNKLWGEIRRAAKSNSALQNALDQCIIIYKLIEEHDDGI